MEPYQPEAGQMIFGQPSQRYDGGLMLDAAIRLLEQNLERVLWNRLQTQADSPFSNTGATFETEGLSIHAYSWGDDEQPWNLKCGDIEISWYKHAWRGVSINQDLANDQIAGFLEKAMAIISACDSGLGYEKTPRWQPFTYCGEMHDETSRE